MKRFYFVAALCGLATSANTSGAAVQPGQNAHRAGFVVGSSQDQVRSGRTLSLEAPATLRSKATGFYGADWTILWDTDTGIPTRIFGAGRAFPGTVADAQVALAAAETVLAEQLALLAPGSSASDFAVVSNGELNGVRSVNFAQHHRGVRVKDAFIGFRFKADRLVLVASEALPSVTLDQFATPLPQLAAGAAINWLDSDLGAATVALSVGEPIIVPMVRGPGAISFHTTLPVSVSARDGVGEWTVYVDSNNRPVGRTSSIHFAEGTILYNVPERWPGDTRSDFPARLTNQNVDGLAQTSDANGVVTFANASATVLTGLTGALTTILNQGGNSSEALTVNDGDSVTWLGGDADPLLDAELAVFIHTNVAMSEALILNPDLPKLADPIPANVNRTDFECNAFANANDINFFVASEPVPGLLCGNTGQLADVIYHEFGHYLHINTINVNGGSFDSAFSEGLSDYYAASITGDSAMGRGFFRTEDPLRPIDGPGGDIYWPQAFWDNVDTHYTGVVFAGAMWDLRLALIAELGDTAGDALADRLFYGAVQRASSVDTAYAEVLLEDDDDGNLANGTPNKCAIDYAFGTHGFGPARSILGEGLDLHTRERFTISIAEKTPASGCPAPAVGSIEVFWRLRSDPETNGTEQMALASGVYAATIPTQAEGEVIEYQITITYADGNVRRVPLNFSDKFFEFFNGETEEIYCTDFETDPVADGWQLNGFEHGAPNGGENNTDPPAAFSGGQLVGNTLAGNGAYDANIAASLLSPAIDVSGRSNVRVQFQRWLNANDGQFDRAGITVNATPFYANLASEFLFAPELQLDHEWKFTDLDVSSQSAGGSIQVRFDLTGGGINGNLFGGWNIDDFCVVSFVPSVCGDGNATGNEECDDGAANSDVDPDVCRADCSAAFCGDSVLDSGEECDDGNTVDGDTCSPTCVDLSPDDGGCGCRSSGASGAGGLLLVALVLLGLRRRRRVGAELSQ